MYKNVLYNVHEIPSTGRNILKIFCVFLFLDYLSDNQKMLQLVSTHDRNIEYQTWSFCCNFFLCYADTSHIDTQTKC